MDGRLVTGLPSNAKGVEEAPFFRYFEEAFPSYLSIGMSWEQFWNGPSDLTRAYRKADALRLNRTNQEMWLNGQYIYNAILCTAPVLNAFSKNHTPLPYPDKPIPLTQEQAQTAREEKEQEQMNAGLRHMQMLAAAWNAKLGEGGGKDGERD